MEVEVRRRSLLLGGLAIIGGAPLLQPARSSNLMKPAGYLPKEGTALWKVVLLGTQKTPDEYRKALIKSGCHISDRANDILGKTSCAQQVMEVDLVNISVGELGFTEGAQYKAICAHGVELGLELCPAEVGPALRLAYSDQPRNEWPVVAMEAITDSYGGRSIFTVEHGSEGLRLGGIDVHADLFCRANIRFVFVRRKKNSDL